MMSTARQSKMHCDIKPHLIIASIVVFIGLSLANAFGGAVQLIFYLICLVLSLRHIQKLISVELFLVLACGFIATLSSLQYEPSLVPMLKFIRPFVEGSLLAIVLYHYCKIQTLPVVVTVLSGYVFIELVCAMYMLMFPDFRTVLLNIWYNDMPGLTNGFFKAFLYRGFGISLHHLYGFSLAVGTIAAIIFVLGREQKKWWLNVWYFLIFMASILLTILNARSGLVPVVLIIILGSTVFINYYNLKIVLLLGLFVFFGLQLLSTNSDVMVELIQASLEEGVMQFSDQNSSGGGTVNDLTANIVLPDTLLSWLIGIGHISSGGVEGYSDSGFFSLLQEGGVILIILTLSLYVRMIVSATSQSSWFREEFLQNPKLELLFWVLLITFFFSLVKGASYIANDYSRLMIMLGVIANINRHRLRKDGR